MAISVDYSQTPWLITIPQSDLTFISGTEYQITVDYLWQLLRDYADSEESMPFPVIYRRVAATASTPPITEVNDNYYVAQFEDGLYSVEIINGNSNFRDVEVKNTVSVGTNNTTGFIDPTFLEATLFPEAVIVNTTSGVPLTPTGKTPAGAVIGTYQAPVSNFPDAVTIAQRVGLDALKIIGNATLDAASSLAGYRIFGQNPILTTLTIEASADVTNCEIRDCSIVNSVLDGNNLVRECAVQNLTYVEGILYNCSLGGSIQIATETPTYFFDCKSGCVGIGSSDLPKIDLINANIHLALRNWAGPVEFVNSPNAGTTVCVDVTSGSTVTLSSTVTAGTFYLRGVIEFVDNSGGTTVSSNKAMINPTELHHIWEMMGLNPDSTITIGGGKHLSDNIDVDVIDNLDGTYTLQRN